MNIYADKRWDEIKTHVTCCRRWAIENTIDLLFCHNFQQKSVVSAKISSEFNVIDEEPIDKASG